MKIAIDGPAGVGKSTIAKLLAKKFDLIYINTGAMYRAIAYLLSKEPNFKLDDLEMEFISDKLFVNGEEVTSKIFNEKIDKLSSKVSQNPEVRAALTRLQKNMAEKYDRIVMEGRDIGTVVIPDADFKFFLTASVEERANRRFKQNKKRGISSNIEEIRKAIMKRDFEDTHRKSAPLKKAKDAIEIDTTNLSIEEVINKISHIVEQEGK